MAVKTSRKTAAAPKKATAGKTKARTQGQKDFLAAQKAREAKKTLSPFQLVEKYALKNDTPVKFFERLLKAGVDRSTALKAKRVMTDSIDAPKKGPAPKKLTPAERERQARANSRAIRNADLGPSAKEQAKAQVAKRNGELTGTMSTNDWVFKFEKSTKTTHVYSREVQADDAYRTAKQYLRVTDYPKAPKKIIVKVGIPKVG